MISRIDAWLLLTRFVKNKNLRKHCLACEAAMEDLAPRFDGDPQRWGLAGLLHDLDVELTADNTERHALAASEMLEQEGFDASFIRAVQGHCGRAEREAAMDHALYAADPLTGLIVAAALLHPTRTLAGVDTDFVLKRFKDKRFAAGASREQILACDKIGMELQPFTDSVLGSMQRIADDLGL